MKLTDEQIRSKDAIQATLRANGLPLPRFSTPMEGLSALALYWGIRFDEMVQVYLFPSGRVQILDPRLEEDGELLPLTKALTLLPKSLAPSSLPVSPVQLSSPIDYEVYSVPRHSLSYSVAS